MNPPRIGFTAKIFLSILAGALSGLFFGEMTAVLDPVGNAFIGLMQITVIPTVVIFIITGIGTSARPTRSTSPEGRRVVLVIGASAAGLRHARLPAGPAHLFFSTSGVSGGEETT